MAVSSLERMLDRLVETGLISKNQFQELRERKNPDDTLPSVAGVTRRLVSRGVLTEFQAEQLSDGEPDRLVIGEYILVDVLGSGGMGEVYLARHRMMQREVAIKLLVPRSSEVIESIERFKREVRAAARLTHPNVVTALDAGVRDKQYYLVMECVKGRNLAYLVKSQGAIRLDRALDYTIQAGQGLEYAHRQGIIHRDVKPSNLLVGEDGTVKVSDLGLSRVLQTNEEVTDVNDDGDGLTSSGMIMGTVDFMAPEQAIKPRDADERADIYGLGCTLYFLATGATVFRGDTPMARLIAHREDPVPAITEALPNAPAMLDNVLQRMLAKDPEDRYASISDALRDLRSCLRQYQDGLSNLPETEYRPTTEAAPARRSAFSLVAVLIVLCLVIAGVSGLFSEPEDDLPDPGQRLAGGPQLTTEDSPVAPSVPFKIDPIVHEVTVNSPPLDILQLIDLKNVRLAGEGWRFDSDRKTLTMGQADRPRLALPVSLPDSYWITVDVRRLPMDEYVKGPLGIGLTVGESACIITIDGHRASGLRVSYIAQSRFDNTNLMTVQDQQIAEDGFVTVRVEVDVRASDIASVRVTTGDSPPMEWEGDPTEIEMPMGWSSDWPEPVFIASNSSTQFEVRNFRIGAGPLPAKEPAGPETATAPADDGAAR